MAAATDIVRSCDFAVVGGGPAGSSAARRLALRGARVLLFERQKMPRRKPCGGALSGQAQAFLDFPVPPSLIEAEVYGARLHLKDLRAEGRRPERSAVLVSRAAFDHYLVQKAEEAGAEVVWNEVTGLAVRADRVLLATAAGAVAVKCAIICEGARSRLSRAVRPADGPKGRGFCIEADVPVAGGPQTAAARQAPGPDGMLDLHFGISQFGYGWVFHHGSYYSVGVGGVQAQLDNPLERFRRFVAERGINLNGTKPRGHFLPRGGLRRRLVADRLLLAGDAAGFVDPFLGEGIAYAIRSGQLAADTALEAAARQDFSPRSLEGYRRRCELAFNRSLRGALWTTRGLHCVPRRLVRRLSPNWDTLDQFLLVIQGKLSYGQYLAWLAGRLPQMLWRALTPAKRTTRNRVTSKN